jgi:hypothetical protein
MKIIKKEDVIYTKGQLFVNDDGDRFCFDEIQKDGTYHLLHRYNGKWGSYGDIPLERLNRDYIPVDSFDDLEQAYEEVKANPTAFETDPEEVEGDAETTALAAPASYDTIKQTQSMLAAKKRKVELAQAYIERKKSEMNYLIQGLSRQIARLQKIVDAFDLYLGINEDLVILRTGQPCEDPITLRQMILYMDEEYGDPRKNPNTGQPGLDFQNVEDFDKWLLTGHHLDQVLPERKGIVALKPSRQNRNYSDNPWIDSMLRAKNHMTYLLVRNGENVYRLFTSIAFGERLFPTQVEMDEVIAALQDEHAWPHDIEKVQDGEYIYRRNALIIQGLLDRTQIFQPMAHECSLFKPATYPGCFNLLRDDEMTLDDGHLPWDAWREMINSKIEVGSRIVFLRPGFNYSGYISAKNYSDRFLIYSPHDNYPDLPDPGVYQIEKKEDRPESLMHSARTVFHIKYAPGDEVIYGKNWEYDPHPRKNKVTFLVMASDAFVLNYDQMEIADIEYYLGNRRDRKHYLSYALILWQLRDQLLAEQAKEADFVKLVAGRLDVDESKVWPAVDWFKFKNKWKRRVDSDDAKALRMIEKKIKREDVDENN